MRNVHILVFDDVEVLDLAGPHEVFGAACDDLFEVATLSPSPPSITARGGLRIVPDRSFPCADRPDIFVVPGGRGVHPLLEDERLIEQINRHADRAELVLSVCTGALVLARAGLLSGLRATTHHSSFDALGELDATIDVAREQRFVDEGSIITAAGVSAGIDASLHVVKRLHGEATAERASRYMEYPPNGPNRPDVT